MWLEELPSNKCTDTVAATRLGHRSSYSEALVKRERTHLHMGMVDTVTSRPSEWRFSCSRCCFVCFVSWLVVVVVVIGCVFFLLLFVVGVFSLGWWW